MQNKIIAKKILSVYKYTTLKIVVTPSFNGSVVVLFLIVIFCSATKKDQFAGMGCIVVRPPWARCEFLAELLPVLIL